MLLKKIAPQTYCVPFFFSSFLVILIKAMQHLWQAKNLMNWENMTMSLCKT